ncbi:hypothetical protein [Longibacter salinarum]|nr:hypothetical protein [Longibacter salinarum]
MSDSATNDSTGGQTGVRLRPHGYFSLPDWQPEAMEALRDAIHTRNTEIRLTHGEWTIGAYGLESTTNVNAIGEGDLHPPDRLNGAVAYFCSYQNGLDSPIVYAASTSVDELVEWVRSAPLKARREARDEGQPL